MNDARTLAAEIATHLEGWRVDSPYDHSAHLVRESDGVTLWLRTNDYQHRGRLVVSAGVPDGTSYSDGDTHGIDRPEITVGLTRGAEIMAREITRRLIPGAVTMWEEVAGRIERRTAAKDARETLARELAKIMGSQARELRGEWEADLPDALRGDARTGRYVYGDITPDYDGTSARVEIRGMSADMARELAALVATWAERAR